MQLCKNCLPFLHVRKPVNGFTIKFFLSIKFAKQVSIVNGSSNTKNSTWADSGTEEIFNLVSPLASMFKRRNNWLRSKRILLHSLNKVSALEPSERPVNYDSCVSLRPKPHHRSYLARLTLGRVEGDFC